MADSRRCHFRGRNTPRSHRENVENQTAHPIGGLQVAEPLIQINLERFFFEIFGESYVACAMAPRANPDRESLQNS